MQNIVECPTCRNMTEARAFIGIGVYYRVWIKDLSVVAEPIFRLFRHRHVISKALQEKKRKRNEVQFIWGAEQEKALGILKQGLVQRLR